MKPYTSSLCSSFEARSNRPGRTPARTRRAIEARLQSKSDDDVYANVDQLGIYTQWQNGPRLGLAPQHHYKHMYADRWGSVGSTGRHLIVHPTLRG